MRNNIIEYYHCNNDGNNSTRNDLSTYKQILKRVTDYDDFIKGQVRS